MTSQNYSVTIKMYVSACRHCLRKFHSSVLDAIPSGIEAVVSLQTLSPSVKRTF